MTIVVTLWWLAFWTALGLIVGSFLNAVIYRLPRRHSLRVPLWSACPHCRHRIALYDNVPILSFLLLRGRCRNCGVPIGTRYVVIEATMALIVLMLIDAFMIAGARSGLRNSEFGLTDALSFDWPILLAHVILFACLLAMSAVDLEHYWVDIRFTNFVTVAGFILHTVWTPPHSADWPRPGDTTAVASIFALFGLGFVWIILASQQPVAEPLNEETPEPHAELSDEAVRPRRPPPSLMSPSRGAGWVAVGLLLGTFVVLVVCEGWHVPIRHAGRALIPLGFLFALIISESTVARDSDQAIVEAIHEERHGARGMVLKELALLLPAVLLGCLGLVLMLKVPEFADRVHQILHVSVSFPSVDVLRSWQPLHGFSTAAAGFVVAGALGWAIRILFTLAFGKEAFGTGDIHLMAAAGCVAGWPVVVLAFFLTCAISLLGWLATLPFKRTRALPLGPWLSLSFLIVVIFYDPISRWGPIRNAVTVARWVFLENSQPLPDDGAP